MCTIKKTENLSRQIRELSLLLVGAEAHRLDLFPSCANSQRRDSNHGTTDSDMTQQSGVLPTGDEVTVGRRLVGACGAGTTFLHPL